MLDRKKRLSVMLFQEYSQLLVYHLFNWFILWNDFEACSFSVTQI